MASGTLGQAALAADTNTTVYTVPAGTLTTFNISVVNRAASPVLIRLAVSATGSPTAAEYILYDFIVEQYGDLERTGIVATAGKNVVAYANDIDVSVNVYGLERGV